MEVFISKYILLNCSKNIVYFVVFKSFFLYFYCLPPHFPGISHFTCRKKFKQLFTENQINLWISSNILFSNTSRKGIHWLSHRDQQLTPQCQAFVHMEPTIKKYTTLLSKSQTFVLPRMHLHSHMCLSTQPTYPCTQNLALTITQ